MTQRQRIAVAPSDPAGAREVVVSTPDAELATKQTVTPAHAATSPGTKSPTKRRVETFDLMRGYFLLVIFVDHFAHFPSLLDLATGRGELWASAAEGFFIISGVLVGYIRGKQVLGGGLKLAVQRSWKRAAILYGWSVGLTIAYTLIGRFCQGIPGLKSGLDTSSSVWGLLANTLSLRYTYGWADFLAYYAVYLALAPVALWLIRRRVPWLIAVVSLAVFAVRGNHAFLAWQVYFFLGLTVGYYLRPLERRAAGVPRRTARWLEAGLYAVAAVTVVASACLVHLPSIIETNQVLAHSWLGALQPALAHGGDAVNPWFAKWTFAAGRIPVAALWFAALYILIRRREAWFVRRLGPVLLPVGRNSLFVYGGESAMIFALSMLSPQSLGFWPNSFIAALLLVLVWGLAKLWTWLVSG